MNQLMTSTNVVTLWHEVVKHAEDRCAVSLKEDLESYLVSLLIRYMDKPEMTNQILATAFLEAIHLKDRSRELSLQHVGDRCLLFAGLFPKIAEKRLVKVSYFVDLGRSAYANISKSEDDLYGSLALEFVVLMDVLQSIPEANHLLPLEAYELWDNLGSQRALNLIKAFTRSGSVPIKIVKA